MNTNHTVRHTGRENVEYSFAADNNATRRNSLVILFVVIPVLLVGVYFLLSSM